MPHYTAMNKHIDSQIKYWEGQKEKIANLDKKKAIPFITISREYGAGGFEIATKITNLLNVTCTPGDTNCEWAAYDRKLLEKVMNDMGISTSLAHTLTSDARKTLSTMLFTLFNRYPPQVAIYQKLVETITMLALNGKVIIVGRAGNYFTKDMESGFHVRIVASMEKKIERIAAIKKISAKDAEKLILEKETERSGFFKDFIKHDLAAPDNYHVTLNDSKLSVEESARIIIESMKIKGLL